MKQEEQTQVSESRAGRNSVFNRKVVFKSAILGHFLSPPSKKNNTYKIFSCDFKLKGNAAVTKN